ncbi:haloacid dehalogenase [Phaeosphaeriaceae sp. PMI808]|nr:haloacid dehalogenase [Phaeosphaeriaceae sp. PMI808]
MQATRIAAAKKNLLLCFDAFDTLFAPNTPIPVAYARAAARHGIDCGNTEKPHIVGARFKEAFKHESKQNPNYGKATGLGAEKWWGNVIRKTFTSFLTPGQEVPQALVSDLLQRYSSHEGYNMYPDVKEFFSKLHAHRTSKKADALPWPFEKIVVGVITNSDDRVPSILQSFGLKVNPRRFNTSPQPKVSSSVRNDIDFAVMSYDVGHEKPDQRIFDAALTLATSEDSTLSADFEKLYVGDDLEKDFGGARAAGWHAVLLDRNNGMQENKDFRFGWVGLKDKKGEEKQVLLARSLLDLAEWKPSDG